MGLDFSPLRGKRKGGISGGKGDDRREAYREWFVLKCAIARKIVKEGENG